MNRPSSLRSVVALCVGTFGLSACATLDDGVAARVGDVELTHDALADVLDSDETIAADSAGAMRNFAGLFVANESLKAELEAVGVGAQTVDDGDLALAERLVQEFEQNRVAWQGLSAEMLRDDATQAAYESPDAPIVCTAHVLTETRDEAEAAIDEIDAGRSFGEVAQERSLDPGSAANAGQLGCLPATEFAGTFVTEFVDGALPLAIGEVSPPVESQFGFHVITKVGFDQLLAGELLQLRIGQFDERYDIYVDPQLGQWVEAGVIEPLG